MISLPLLPHGKKQKNLIRDGKHHLVLLDEINIAMRYGYIDTNEVIAFLKTENRR